MKRFSRRRRSGGEAQKRSIDATDWLQKIVEGGIVETTSLEPWTDHGVPPSIAAIGRGVRADGTDLIVAFSPKSATEALLGGLSAAEYAVENSKFSGQVVIVAPQWESGARRLLALLGHRSYHLEPIASPTLGTSRNLIHPDTGERVLATGATQLAARLPEAESRAAFRRAAIALEGLAAKHGGAVRVGRDRLELVVLARRVAEIRVEEDSVVLETQLGGRSTKALLGAELAGPLDALEGQLRRRLNDRKVRDGEEGLRGRVVARLAAGTELRGVRPWPTPGADLDLIDAVGLNGEGQPVIVAIREEFEWTVLGKILEEIGLLAPLLPTLFADKAPPLRLGASRLLLVAERFADGLERAISALTVAYELRAVSGTAGSSVDLVSSGSGDGAQARTGRRGRRRGGRGRASGSGSGSGSGSDEPSNAGGPPKGPASDLAEANGDSPRGPKASRTSESAPGDDDSPDENGGPDRARRRRRPRRGRGASADATRPEKSGRQDRGNDEGQGSDGANRKRPSFEEISLMDLDETPDAGGSSVSSELKSSDAEGEPPTEGGRRPGRRGRRGGRGDSTRGSGGRNRADRGAAGDGGTSKDEASGPDVVDEEDLVDEDDLTEILARLADDESEFDSSDSTEESYEDSEEIDEDDAQSARRRDRDSRRRSSRGNESEEENRPPARGRAAILVHGDRDSLLAAVLLARDIRQLEGIWVYPQAELMTFFRSIATDLRDDTPIFVVGFTPSPARDVIQASSLYRGRLTWFGRQAWPPEDRMALRESLGVDAVHGGEGIDSALPLVLDTCTRRSRFSDKLVDLSTSRFTQHDFERWGRLWRWRAAEIAAKSGDIRADISALLAGRPSDLAKEAALVELPPIPAEVTWVAENDFRLVHFGGQMMVVVEVEGDLDVHLCARVARERYSATLSLAHRVGEESIVFAGDEISGKRAVDYLAVAEHLVNKLEWVEARSDGDHVSRFRVRDLNRYPERLEEIIGEIAMGRSLLER